MNTRPILFTGIDASYRPSPAGGAAEPGPPKDVAEISPQTPRKKRSLLRRLLKIAGWTTAALVLGMTGITAVGYLGNQDALNRPPALKPVEPEKPPAPTRVAAPPVQKPDPALPGPLKLPADTVLVFVPGETARDVTWSVQSTPRARAFIDEKVAESREHLQGRLQNLKVPDGAVLLDLEIPLPTGDQAFLHVGGVDLPSLGYRSLATESVPLVLRYSANPVSPSLDVQVKPFQAENPVGEGVYLGSVRVILSPKDRTIPVSGSLDLALDLDGEATQQRLTGEQRERRLQQARRLRELGDQQGFTALLQDAFQEQRVDFDARVELGDRPLVAANYHLWLGPDVTGDGRADLTVTHDAETALEGVQVHIDDMRFPGKDPQGRIGRYVNQRVEAEFRKGIEQQLPEVTQKLREVALEKVGDQLAQGAPWAQAELNEKLGAAYQKPLDFELPGLMPGEAPTQLRYAVGPVHVRDGMVVAEMRTLRPTGATEEVRLPFAVGPGEVGVRLPGSELNRRLLDKSKGGAVDWKALLAQVKKSNQLLDLEFGRDRGGNVVYPRLVVDAKTGQPAVAFDVIVKLPGAKPVEGGTGLVTGATGALDGGLADVQKGLKKGAGVPGEVIGGVLRAPFFIIDQVAKGGKAVVDNTAGVVVDGVTDVATRPTIHTHVVIPLDLAVKDGQLAVTPNGDKVHFSTAKGDLPFDALNLLPTRLVSNLIVNLVAEASGPGQVGNQAQQRSVDVSLAGQGLTFGQVAVIPRPGSSPDFAVTLRPSQGTAEFLAGKILPGN